MGYDPRIILQQANGGFVPAPNTLRNPQDIIGERQRQEVELQNAKDAARAAGQTAEYNERTLDSRVGQSANLAERGGLENQGLALGIPQKRLEAKQAGVESNYLDQMYPGAGQQQPPNIPPPYQPQSGGLPMSRESDAPPQAQIPPAVQNQFAGKSLSELMQMKAQAGPAGEFLGKFIDPLIQRKILTEKQAMYDDLNSPQWQAKINGIGIKNTNGSNAFNEFRKTHPIIELLPETEQAKIQTESFKANAQPNMAMIGSQPPPASVLDNAARRIANKESTVSEEINKGRFTGSTAMQIHDNLVERVRALDPNFSEADSEAGYAFGKNPGTRKAISQLDNAYSTLDRLRGVYSKLNNSQYPTINKALNAGALETGDVDAARASIAEVLGNDELTQAFSRGGMGSDKLREMSSKLANYNLSPQQMTAQFDEIMHGLERSRNAYVGQGGGYIKPLKTASAEGGSAATVWRADKNGKQWEYDAATKKPTGNSR